VHLPNSWKGDLPKYAATILASVAKELQPLLIAVPERELGDGLVQRVTTVARIRRELDLIGWYCPLHLLGTGNPLSIAALSAAGADSFDGLEWCRTVVDYATGYLFHCQHFDCFSDSRGNRIQVPRIRQIVESVALPYALRALSYNVDYFKDMSQTLRGLIRSGQTKTLLNTVPDIGATLFKVISQ
jgi:hypothetical protein